MTRIRFSSKSNRGLRGEAGILGMK